MSWQAEREKATAPGPAVPEGDPPPLLCTGTAAHCAELVNFSPAAGAGYLDYLVKDETWGDQYRSWIRRDFMQAVRYAAARVEEATAGWDYEDFSPIGLGDMSDPAGLAPTTGGVPDHSTHEDGNHIDVAYYQLYAPDNLLRPVGRHRGPTGLEAWHLTAAAHALDPWRTALFVAHLFEHPYLRFVLVDDQVGPVLEAALATLADEGRIEPEVLERTRVVYAGGDQSLPYFFAHHEHLHASMLPLLDIVADAVVEPGTLNRNSQGRFVTVRIELGAPHDAAGHRSRDRRPDARRRQLAAGARRTGQADGRRRKTARPI